MVGVRLVQKEELVLAIRGCNRATSPDVMILSDGFFGVVLRGRISIFDFVYISRKFPSGPRLFFPWKRRNICAATLWISDWNISIL
jgi:hypothetical protein